MAPYGVLPAPDALTEPYWEAAREGKLAVQRCEGCSRYHHPPVYFCVNCRDENAELRFSEVSGRGTVYSHYIHYDSEIRAFRDKTPYPVVMVELDEQPGLFLLANLLDSEFDRIHAGMAVEVVFDRASDDIRVPQFRPAAEGKT